MKIEILRVRQTDLAAVSAFELFQLIRHPLEKMLQLLALVRHFSRAVAQVEISILPIAGVQGLFERSAVNSCS